MDILLIPGFMLDPDLWRDMRPQLERYGNVVDVDTTRDTSIEAMADRAVARMAEPSVVVGFSMGGYVAREITYRAPERVVGLALIATSMRDDAAARDSPRRVDPLDALSFRRLSSAAVKTALHPTHHNPATIDRVRAMSERLGAPVYRRQRQIERLSDVSR